jgi:glycosyltransferase involved in cell wall biosynthesis
MSFKVTGVIPVGNLARDKINLARIIQLSNNYPVKLLIVMDCQDKDAIQEFKETNMELLGEQVKILESDFGNPGGARQVGLQNVDTDWVCFWDSDDLPDVQNIIGSVDTIIPSRKILVGGFTVVDLDGKNFKANKFEVSRPDRCLRELARNPGIWRIAVSFEILRNLQFMNLSMGEDQLFIAEILALGEEIEFSSENFYFYNAFNPSSLTKNSRAFLDLSSASTNMREILNKSNERHFETILRMYIFILISSLKRLPLRKKSLILRQLIEHPLIVTRLIFGK